MRGLLLRDQAEQPETWEEATYYLRGYDPTPPETTEALDILMPKPYQKVALYKFSPPLDAADEEEFFRLARALAQIPGILRMAVGHDESGRAQGDAYGLSILFIDQEAHEDFRQHRRHQDFATFVRSRQADIHSCNYSLDPRNEFSS